MTRPATMPRIVVACAVLVGACFFQADYTGGHFRCTDGKCPSGLTCVEGTCGIPIDARIDTPDTAIDAKQAALTCADPGPFPTAGGSASGSTNAPHTNLITATCGGFVMNGNDAVYKIDAALGDHIALTIAGNFMVYAYAISPCMVSPAMPSCIGTMPASPGTPITITAPATATYFLVVDAVNPAQHGSYTLAVTH